MRVAIAGMNVAASVMHNDYFINSVDGGMTILLVFECQKKKCISRGKRRSDNWRHLPLIGAGGSLSLFRAESAAHHYNCIVFVKYRSRNWVS